MIRYAYWTAIMVFVGLVGAKFDRHTGFTGLIRFGETWQGNRHHSLKDLPIATVANSNGYDGQFYAQIALEPSLQNPELEKIIDAPSYRSRRIFVPAIAAVAGYGSAWRTLQAYALINVASWIALGWLLRKWIGSSDWICFARWIGCMFSMGVLDSVRQSLVDLPALLLLLFAVDAHKPCSYPKGTLWLALGSLAKETTFIGTAALHVRALFNHQERGRAILAILLATAPIGMWWLYANYRFSSNQVTMGLGNFAWPFLGIINETELCLKKLAQGDFDGRYSFGLIAIVGLAVQIFVLWRKPEFDSPRWRVGACYSLLLPFLSLWVWSGYWAVCRAVLPLTICFNLLLPANRAFWPLWTLGNLTLLHAVWRFL